MKYSHLPLTNPAAVSGQKGADATDKRTVSQVVQTGATSVLAYSAVAPANHADAVANLTTHTVQVDSGSAPRSERYRLAFVIIVTSFYGALLTWMLYLSTGQADVGLSAQPDASGEWVVTWVVPAGLSYDLNVRPGDRIVSVDGGALPEGLAPDGTMSLRGATSVVVREAETGGKLITIDTSDIDGGDPLKRWGYALLGLIFIGVGGPVYIKARQRTAASSFYIFCVATAVALALATAVSLLYREVLALLFITLVWWAGSFAYFFLNFPVRIGKTMLSRTLIVTTLVGTGALVLLSYGLAQAGDLAGYELGRALGYAYIAGCVVTGLGCMVRSLIAERSAEVRQQLVLLLGGTAVAVGPSLLLGLLPNLILKHELASVEVTAMALGIMPLAFAYAITQHQLLGVRSFMRRSVVYVVMGSTVLMVLSLAVTALSASGLAPNNWAKTEVGLIGFSLFIFLIALSFGFLQRRVERLVDRYIYHDSYDYKEALLSFSSQLASEQKLQVLSDQLVERTCRLMNLSCGVLLLSEHPDGVIGTAPHANDIPKLLIPYSKYGDCADWLIRGLQNELSQLGIGLGVHDAPVQLIELNKQEAYSQNERETTDLRLHTHVIVGSEVEHVAGVTTSNGNGAGSMMGDTGRHSAPQDTEPNTVSSFLGVPLWTRSRFVGVLCLGGKRTGEHFTKDDLALLSTLGSQAALAVYNAQLHEAREHALLDTIAALAFAIEAKDGYTINHCEQMMGRAVALAQAMRLPSSEVENIRLGAILHDVGKIGIPDAVLNKPGPLNDEEYEVIKGHAQIGARIVQSVAALQDVVPIVRHHQERYDGTGYPDGIAGEEIPLGARIISVVDTYGAMTEDRIYRKALGHRKAIAEIKRHAGKQFDPVIVDAFIRMVEEHPEYAEISYYQAS